MREIDSSERSLVIVLEDFVKEFKKLSKDVSKIVQHLTTNGEGSEKSTERESDEG